MSCATTNFIVSCCEEPMDPLTELRHLPSFAHARLGQMLGDNRSGQWQAVMTSIPSTPPWTPGTPLPIHHNYQRKYSANDIKLLEIELSSGGRLNCGIDSGISLLLEEWSCSGVVRPTITDLVILLDHNNLFAASSFIRKNVLKETSTGSTQQFRHLDNLIEENSPSSVRGTNSPSSIMRTNSSFSNGGTNSPSSTRATIAVKPVNDTCHIIGRCEGDADLDNLLAEHNNIDIITPAVSYSSRQTFQHLDKFANEVQQMSLETTAAVTQPVIFDPSSNIVPHISYDFLFKVTDSFCNVAYSDGGRKLGEGAFGMVYKADISIEDLLGNNTFTQHSNSLLISDNNNSSVSQPGNNSEIKQLAIKKLNFSDERINKQFKIEIETLSECNHGNILPLEGYSCDGPHCCLVYAFMLHGNLQDRLACHGGYLPLTPHQRIKIGLGSAEGLAYLHTFREKALIHRDVKSANILLDAHLIPRIGDFGLVRMGGAGSHTETLMKTTTVFGTSAYMAPEAFRGDVSTKLDTFSYGVVLLEVLTGLPPYDEDRDGRDLLSHIEGSDETADKISDNKVSSWPEGLPEALLDLATLCFQEKKARPTMVDVVGKWKPIVQKWN